MIGVTVVAAVIRFTSLDAQSFDIGELFTVRLVRMPFGEMLRGVVDTEGTPHLYYVVAWVYARLFGTGEIGLRSLSALLGTVTVPIVHLAARTMAGRRVAVVAAALAAFNPLLVVTAQSVRAYALAVPLAAASLLFLAQSLARPEGNAPRRLSAAVRAGLATHYSFVFLWLPHAVLLARRRAGETRR